MKDGSSPLTGVARGDYTRSITPTRCGESRHTKTSRLATGRGAYGPLEGRVQLRPAAGAGTHGVRIVEPVGTLAFRVARDGSREGRRHASSTSQYEMNARIVVAVGMAGPVLVVMSTRVMARQMARAIAGHLDESRATRELTAFVRARLGGEHPLVPLLPYRVAYHHAGLPTDVLEALEQGLREERLLYLAATTTLTEGVNLPVRSVVLAETRYEGQDPGAQILGARLINAMGRAGRATKESEGWVVVCKAGTPAPADFDQMRPVDEDLSVTSRLATADALEALATFEETAAGAADAVFEHHAGEVDDFITFVWLVLTSFDELDQAASAEDIDEALSSTLAFAQLSAEDQARWKVTARMVQEAFRASERSARRRWAKTGTSIGSARSLDQIAQQVASEAQRALILDRPIEQPDVALEVLDTADALNSLLALEESPRDWGFRRTPNAAPSIDVSPRAFLQRWIFGAEIATLASEFLAAVPTRELAVEQIVDVVSEHCEHYLSWTLGVIVTIANGQLTEGGVERKLCENLPLYVRYGVDSAEAVELISSGLRSRGFAHRVAAVAGAHELGEGGLREWLQTLSIDRWRPMFEGTPADFLDLLEFTRTRGRGLLGALLADEQAGVEAELDESAFAGPVSVQLVEADQPPQRFGVFRDGERVGVVSPAAHADVAAVLDSGLEFRANLVDGTLVLNMSAESADAS